MSAGFFSVSWRRLADIGRQYVSHTMGDAFSIQKDEFERTFLALLWTFVRLLSVWLFKAVNYHLRSLANRSKVSREPPAFAESILLLLVKPKYRDSLSITLAEEFERRLQTGCSVKRARRLYWISVFNSLGPQLKALIRRYGLRLLNWIGAAGLIEEVVRRLTH